MSETVELLDQRCSPLLPNVLTVVVSISEHSEETMTLCIVSTGVFESAMVLVVLVTWNCKCSFYCAVHQQNVMRLLLVLLGP